MNDEVQRSAFEDEQNEIDIFPHAESQELAYSMFLEDV